MTSNITRTQTPEERELAAKDADLSASNARLAERELDFATLRFELHAFEQQYLGIVGVKFAEIDDLEAQIAETLDGCNPSDDTAREAREARQKAAESAGVAGAIEQRKHAVDFKPSEDLKRLYREIAKRIHPDLATDDDERAKRTQVMAEVNRAYSEGAEARLHAILNEWETSPDAVTGDGIGAELVRTIRKIHQVDGRLARIEIEIAALNGSELAVLMTKAEGERMNGRDLLVQMAEQVDTQILQLRRKRDGLMSKQVST